jgi:3-oxoacyl-[acyl-carrier-protein] synthase-3
MTDRGRGVSIILVMGQEQRWLAGLRKKVLGYCLHLHSEGEHAKELAVLAPGMGGRWVTDILSENDPEDVSYFPYMNGQFVFKNAVQRFSEVIHEGLGGE